MNLGQPRRAVVSRQPPRSPTDGGCHGVTALQEPEWAIGTFPHSAKPRRGDSRVGRRCEPLPKKRKKIENQ